MNMAKLFRGMSTDNFLDGLVEKTGLNGHELYDYLVKLTGDKPAIKEKEEKNELFFPHGEYAFIGDLSELGEFYKLHGGTDEMAKWFGTMIPGLVAIHVASVMKLEKFAWIRPTRFIGRDGSMTEGLCKYSCWWRPEDQKYDFDDGERVAESEIFTKI